MPDNLRSLIKETCWETPIGVLTAKKLLEDDTAVVLRDKNNTAIIDSWPDFAFRYKKIIADSRWNSGWDFRCVVGKVEKDIALPPGAVIGWNDGTYCLINMSMSTLQDYKTLIRDKLISDPHPTVVMQRTTSKRSGSQVVTKPNFNEFPEINALRGKWWTSPSGGCIIQIIDPAWHLTQGKSVALCVDDKGNEGWYFWSSFMSFFSIKKTPTPDHMGV